MNAVQKHTETAAPVAHHDGSIVNVIAAAAANPDVNVDKLERLLAMQERIMERDARAAYSAALADMQPKLPAICMGGKNTHTDKAYSRLEDINGAIRPILAEHGFALSFRIGRDANTVIVTGVLSHREGHSEETSIHLPADTGAGRNAVQAVGSSVTYGKRYTATALLNLTSGEEDDDGIAAGHSAFQAAALAALEACGADQAKLDKWHADNNAAVRDRPAAERSQIIAAYQTAIRKARAAR
jgi:hypothetical protein